MSQTRWYRGASSILATMKPSVLVLLALLAAALAPGQPESVLYPIREASKWGFIDRSGAVVVAPAYAAVGEVHEGRIRVNVGPHAGYIDVSGKVVIEPKYDTAGNFRNARAVVMIGGKYSLIDPSGKLIADIPYRVLGDFHQGLLRVQANNLTDSNGKKLPTKYGFVDHEGKVAIPPQFMPVGEFPDDSSNLPAGGLDREWVYFDRSGKIEIRIPFGEHLENPNPFADGRLRFKQGFNWGYKDASGGWAIPPKYNDARDFENGTARVQEGDKWITIDIHGKPVPLDKKALRVIGPYSDGLALAADNGLMGWVDQREKLAFPLRKYQKAFAFSDGLARFELDDLYGYLDRSGNITIPNKYATADDFDHGLARVVTGSRLAYIDTKGQVVWQARK
jgi:hypothetical protein